MNVNSCLVRAFLGAFALLAAVGQPARVPAAEPLFARSNLIAWCIVPFDARKRGPEERAAMMERLGIKHFAYDYRAEHIPSFDAEVEACQRHGVSLDAWWFPTELNAEAKQILEVVRRHHLKLQLWVTGGGAPTKSPEEQRARVESEALRIRPIAEAARKLDCTVGLYNHGGWFGEPENQLEILERLRRDGITNVGLVYNLHHGHDHLRRFVPLLQKMKPHLLVLNLNGMTKDGDKLGKKILPLAQGDMDFGLLRVIRDSGWRGPLGILNHTDEDAEARLRDNLEGLDWLVARLEGKAPGAKPKPRSWKEPTPSASSGGRAPVDDLWALEDPKSRAALPVFKVIPAAKPEQLTAASGWPSPNSMTNWHRSLGDPTSSRFSALTQINRETVKRLEVAWTYHSKDGSANLQCNPIIIGDVIYAPTVGHRIAALNAETGRELWRFKPELPAKGMRPEDAPARRGMAYWPGDARSPARILFTAGAWLYALDPKGGQLIESFGQHGRTPLPAGGIVAGAVHKDIFVIPGLSRDVFGYNVRDGKRVWTFHTIPEPGEEGHDTWSRTRNGAGCWGGMALDEPRGIAYVSTGSPKPDFIGLDRRGDNQFANCVIALDAQTGRRLWHFQEVRHDLWGLDLAAPPNLVTVTHDGRRVDAVAQVTKLGNTLLLDRVSGQPLFPVRLRRAPVSRLPGEQTAPYQPDIEIPEPFIRQTFSRDQTTNIKTQAHETVTKMLAGVNLGFFEPFENGRPTVFFGARGGAEWTGAAFDPATGFLYVSANEIPGAVSVFQDEPEPKRDPINLTNGERIYETLCAACHAPDRAGYGVSPPLRGLRLRMKESEVVDVLRNGRNFMPALPPMTDGDFSALLDFLLIRDHPWPKPDQKFSPPSYLSYGYTPLVDLEDYPGCKPPWGTLNCIDLNTGKLRWKVPLGEDAALTGRGVTKTGTENFGGAMVTAGGLVFCAGTKDRKIRAFDKDTGAEVWSEVLPFAGTAPPATYLVNGRQYVLIAATGGSETGGPPGDAWVAFALPRASASR